MVDVYKKKKTQQHLWTFLASKLAASLGSSIYSFGISFYILSVTGSALSFAVNLILNLLPRALFSPIAGYLADHYNKKAIIIVSQSGSALTMAALLAYSMANGLSIHAIYTATALISVTSTFSSLTFTSAIPNLVDPENIQKAMSYNQISLSLATIGGPTIGGLLYGFLTLPTFIAIFIIAYTIAAILDATMDFRLYKSTSSRLSVDKKDTVYTGIKNGFVYMRKNELISRIILVALFINFFFGATDVGFSYVMIGLLKVEPAHYGLVEACTAIGTLAASIYIGIRKAFRSPLLLSKWGIISMAAIMGFTALPLLVQLDYWGNVSYFGLLMFLFGVLVVFVNTPLLTLIQMKVLEEYRGRVFSLLETGALALMPAGTLLYGVLYDMVPPSWLLIISAIFLIMIVLLLVPAPFLERHSAGQAADGADA